MSKIQKTFTAILVFIVLVLVFILFLPNLKEGGNKSIFHVKPNAEKSEKHQAAKEEESTAEESTAAVNTVNTPYYILTFTAFKTPDKIGVDGFFDDIKLTNLKDGEKLSDRLKGSTFLIDSHSLNTKDPTGQRDPKLIQFFFDKLASPSISGTFNGFDNGKAQLTIKMNNQSKNFEFDFQENDNGLDINGSIDIVKDFEASSALSSIAEVCKDLHANKTWPEVSLKIQFQK